MKRLTLSLATLVLSIITINAKAQTDAEMKAWQNFMTPGDIHKMMASWDGEWTEDIEHWMQPGAAPQKSSASLVNRMILGGRYQESKHTGSFFGMPFEAIGTLAYDNAKKKFVSTWLDNMGTGIAVLEGNWDEATKTIDLKGNSTDPLTGKDMPMRQTLKVVDNKTMVIGIYSVFEGKEFKNMEITVKRK